LEVVNHATGPQRIKEDLHEESHEEHPHSESKSIRFQSHDNLNPEMKVRRRTNQSLPPFVFKREKAAFRLKGW